MPRPMLFRDQANELFGQMGRTEPPRPPLSQAQADEWHRSQFERHRLEQARQRYYLSHSSGDPVFPGDEA